MIRNTPHKGYRMIVRRAENAARNEVPPLLISDICDLLSIEPRELNRAFRAVHGCAPYRFFRRQRYDVARKELMTGRKGASVSQIARRLGFTELGRFSVRYREYFAESPSITLAKALARRDRKARHREISAADRKAHDASRRRKAKPR